MNIQFGVNYVEVTLALLCLCLGDPSPDRRLPRAEPEVIEENCSEDLMMDFGPMGSRTGSDYY